jgi:hypothetical protein
MQMRLRCSGCGRDLSADHTSEEEVYDTVRLTGFYSSKRRRFSVQLDPRESHPL